MAKNSETTLKTLRLKTQLIKELEKKADEDNRNFNNYVETVLMRAVS